MFDCGANDWAGATTNLDLVRMTPALVPVEIKRTIVHKTGGETELAVTRPNVPI
jgi:hypothetical protein